MQQLMEWNHGQYDFDIALDKTVSGAAKDIETDDEYKFNWKTFGYYCLEKYPEFIRKEVLEKYKNGEPNVVDSLIGLAYDHAHYIEFADFDNDQYFDPKYSLYRALKRGVSKEDLPEETSLTTESERYDSSKILYLVKKHSLSDLSIDDEYLVGVVNRMTSTTERKQIKIERD